MDSDVMASIYAQVVSGTKKEDSHLVTDEDSSRAWDVLTKQVEQMRANNPDVHFEIPSEIPGRPGTSVLGEGAPAPAASQASTAPSDAEEPPAQETPAEDATEDTEETP